MDWLLSFAPPYWFYKGYQRIVGSGQADHAELKTVERGAQLFFLVFLIVLIAVAFFLFKKLYRK